MSRLARDRGEAKKIFLGETDLFFFFLKGGRCESQAARIIEQAETEQIELRTSSEIYDDAISAIRAGGGTLSLAQEFVSDMKSIPHSALPMNGGIAEEAMKLYGEFGGRRRLSYFDSFHVATARWSELALLTSDKYILDNAVNLHISVVDLSAWI